MANKEVEKVGKRLKVLLAIAGAAVLALGTAPAAAQAAAPAMAREPVQQATAAACGESYWAFGYTGTMRCGTLPLRCDWDNNGTIDEVFVIAPSRTIWHAWPGSGGWKEMPNNGSADNTWKCYRKGKGQRQVEVWTSSPNVWYSYYSGGWQGWYYYPGS
jgi:hypothetical protein